VNRCQHMAKTYTVFKIIERSIILDLCGEAFGRVPAPDGVVSTLSQNER
jgi:hypothetical protein